MSYLSQLAARTLNQLPSVQPHLPSRFESAQREVRAEARIPLEYATFTSSAPSIPAIAATPAEAAPAPPYVVAADSPTPSAAAAPVPHPTLDAAPTHTKLVYQAEPRSEMRSEQPATPPPVAPIERNTATRVIEHVSSTISTNTTIEQHSLPEQRTLVEHERILAPMPSATPPEGMRAQRIVPHITPYVPPAKEYAPLPEPAPVIQVSIGRIEVRAIHTPPASAPQTSAPRPGLSLDEYLRGGQS